MTPYHVALNRLANGNISSEKSTYSILLEIIDLVPLKIFGLWTKIWSAERNSMIKNSTSIKEGV